MANKDVEILIRSATAHYEAKEYDAAIADYTRAIDIAPNKMTAMIYLFRGQLHARKGCLDHMEEFDLAFFDYQQASILAPNDEEIKRAVAEFTTKNFIYRGIAYGEQKRYDSAVADFKKSIELLTNPLLASGFANPMKVSVEGLLAGLRFQELYEHAVICEQNKDYAGAITDFEKLLILAPDKKYAINDVITKLQGALRAEEKAKQAEKKAELLREMADKAEENWRELAGDDWYDWEGTDASNDFETYDTPSHGVDSNSSISQEESIAIEPLQSKTRKSMQILDNMNYPLGSIDENGVIMDLMNYPKGQITADGTIMDLMNYPKGRIGTDGTIYDLMNYPKGRIDDNGTILDNMNYPKGSVK